MSMSAWMPYGYPGYAGYPGCYPMDARNPYASLQNLNYMPFSPMHRLSPFTWMDPYSSYSPPYPYPPYTPYSLFDPLGTSRMASTGNLGDILNSCPSVIPMISETNDHLDRIDRMCKEESKKLRQYKKKIKTLQTKVNYPSDDMSSDGSYSFRKVKKRRRYKYHS